MKDFEFITEEEWNVFIKLKPLSMQLGLIQKLLNEKVQKGYTSFTISLDKGYVSGTIKKPPYCGDTHEAFVFLRKIEEEVEECVHDYTVYRKGGLINIYYCPKCGKKLK